MKDVTLVFPLKDDTNEILLAMKKARFGAGKFNGMGGKCEPGETLRESAVREVREEVGIEILAKDLVPVADITFLFPDNKDWEHHCYVYVVRKWVGEPIESEEMTPRFFKQNELPYDRMWVSDPLWLPLALAGRRVKGDVYLSATGSAVISASLKEDQELSF